MYWREWNTYKRYHEMVKHKLHFTYTSRQSEQYHNIAVNCSAEKYALFCAGGMITIWL